MWAITLVSIFGICLSTGHKDPNDQTVKMEIEINAGQLSTNISRITGGVEAERHAYPWQVRMGVIFEDDDGKRRSKGCGGTIICPKFIMTAAHCLECVNKRKHPRRCDKTGPFFQPYQLSVLVGAHNVKDFPWPYYVLERGATLHRVSRTVIHPQRNRAFALYDFALLQLQDSIVFWEGARPLYLPEPCNIDTETRIKYAPLAVSGWGATQNDFQDKDILRVVSIRFIATAKCPIENFRIGRTYRPGICAGIPNPGNPDQGKDACFGDSGGS